MTYVELIDSIFDGFDWEDIDHGWRNVPGISSEHDDLECYVIETSIKNGGDVVCKLVENMDNVLDDKWCFKNDFGTLRFNIQLVKIENNLCQVIVWLY